MNNNLPNDTEMICVQVFAPDLDFDDSQYCHADKLCGEMAVLKDVQPPDDLRPVEVPGLRSRERFDPLDQSTWLQTTTDTAEYFKDFSGAIDDYEASAADDFANGARSAVVKAVPIAAATKTVVSALKKSGERHAKAVKTDVEPVVENTESGKKAALSELASALATAAESRTVVSKASEDITQNGIGVIAGESAEEDLKVVLGYRKAFVPDLQEQLRRIFPRGIECSSCKKSLTELRSVCYMCGKPSGLEFAGVKHIRYGLRNAAWLDAEVAAARLLSGLIFVLLIASPIYLAHIGRMSLDMLRLFAAGIVVWFIVRLVALSLKRRWTIAAARKKYLSAHSEIHAEVKDALLAGRYSLKMSPEELELVEGRNIYADVKNNCLLFFIGDSRFR